MFFCDHRDLKKQVIRLDVPLRLNETDWFFLMLLWNLEKPGGPIGCSSKTLRNRVILLDVPLKPQETGWFYLMFLCDHSDLKKPNCYFFYIFVSYHKNLKKPNCSFSLSFEISRNQFVLFPNPSKSYNLEQLLLQRFWNLQKSNCSLSKFFEILRNRVVPFPVLRNLKKPSCFFS